MQFLLYSQKANQAPNIRQAASFLFHELGFFFQHISTYPNSIHFPQILCTFFHSENNDGICFLGDFDRQLNTLENLVRSGKPTDIEMSYAISDKKLVIEGNLLAWIYFVIAHREEQLIDPDLRDSHNRIPYQASVAHIQKWLEEPLISATIHRLSTAIKQYMQHLGIPLICKTPWPGGKQKALLLSHDIDILDKWFLMAVKMASENLFNKQMTTFFKIIIYTLKNLLKRRNPAADVHWMLELEKKFGFVSSYHFLSGQATLRSLLQADITYNVKQIAAILPKILKYGAEIALHSSYFTFDQEQSINDQIRKLQKATEMQINGVRAHFLRTNGIPFLQAAEKAGLVWDSSEAFAEVSGFKTGFTGPYRPVANSSTMDLWEFPLHWMDRTYSKYSATSVDEIFESFVGLAGKFETFGGVLTLLWHNYTVSDFGFIGYEKLYEQILNYLHQSGFYNDSPQNIVRWLNQKKTTELIIEDNCCILAGQRTSKKISIESELFRAKIIKVDCSTLELEEG